MQNYPNPFALGLASLLLLLQASPAPAATVTLAGKTLECKAATTIAKDGTGPGSRSPAMASIREKRIDLDLNLMKDASAEAQAHIFCHECGHLDGNADESAADVYGLMCAKAHGFDATKTASAACKMLRDMPGDDEHPAGSARCSNLQRVAQCITNTGGEGDKSCLQGAQGDPVAVAGDRRVGFGEVAGKGSGGEDQRTADNGSNSDAGMNDDALAQMGQAWLSGTRHSLPGAKALTQLVSSQVPQLAQQLKDVQPESAKTVLASFATGSTYAPASRVDRAPAATQSLPAIAPTQIKSLTASSPYAREASPAAVTKVPEIASQTGPSLFSIFSATHAQVCRRHHIPNCAGR